MANITFKNSRFLSGTVGVSVPKGSKLTFSFEDPDFHVTRAGFEERDAPGAIPQDVLRAVAVAYRDVANAERPVQEEAVRKSSPFWTQVSNAANVVKIVESLSKVAATGMERLDELIKNLG